MSSGDAPTRVPLPAGEQAEAVLRETRQFYVALDETGVVRSWNRAATRIFGYDEQQAVGAQLEELIIPPTHRASHTRGIADFVRTGRGRGIDAPVEVRAVRADGSEVAVELTIWAQQTPAGYVFHALGADLTERHRHEHVLRVLAEHRRLLLHLERAGEAQGLLVDTVRRATGCDAARLYVPDRRDEPEALRLVAESLGGAPSGPAALARDESPGVWSALLERAAAVHDDSCCLAQWGATAQALRSVAIEPVLVGEQAVGVLVVGWSSQQALETSTRELLSLLAGEAGVVMQRLELQEQLAAAARTDSLTGLPNRRAFDEALGRELQQALRDDADLTLALLDLDRFKEHNDTYGHPSGDDLLRRVTAAWRAVVRAPELLARIGGDEFALLLPGTDEAEAAAAVSRLLTATPADTSLCAGTAGRLPGDDAAALLMRADQALYRAKRARP